MKPFEIYAPMTKHPSKKIKNNFAELLEIKYNIPLDFFNYESDLNAQALTLSKKIYDDYYEDVERFTLPQDWDEATQYVKKYYNWWRQQERFEKKKWYKPPYKGEIKGMDETVVNYMILRQIEQGNPENIKVFEVNKERSNSQGGFDWRETPEGFKVWREALRNPEKDEWDRKKFLINKIQYQSESITRMTEELKNKYLDAQSTNDVNLFTFLDEINCDLELRRYANQSGRWTAQIERAEIKEGCILAGKYGTGKTPAQVVEDYVRQIKDKLIVINAGNDSRKEFKVPERLFFTYL